MTDATMRVALYAAVGRELMNYGVDIEAGTLTERGLLELPANVQYGWPHASGRRLYLGCSDSPTGRGAFVGGTHSLSALEIDPASGAMSRCGDPVSLPTRPIHVTTDIPSEHVLVALANPSQLHVYRTNPDGSIGELVHQADAIAAGNYLHQVRVRPDNRAVVLTDRGLGVAAGDPEQSGCLRMFDYRDGGLTRGVVAASQGEHGFSPRHLDFHPTQPWLYVVLEPQNRLAYLAFEGTALRPVCERDTLIDPAQDHRQAASAVHVHPNGRTVYVANRATSTTGIRNEGVSTGGENTLAVFNIDPLSGIPLRVQSIDAAGIHCRTFHIDPSGRLLVAAHAFGVTEPEGTSGHQYEPGLSLFRIADDGKLSFLRKYAIDVGSRQLFWIGMIGCPGA